MAVTKRTRYEVLRRDGHACRYCGASAPEVKLTVDHVVPVALGGSDDPSNLVACCGPCNSGKTSTSPDAAVVEQVASEQFLWAAALQEALAEVAGQSEDALKYRRQFVGIWENWTVGGEKVKLPDDWASTLQGWQKLGLPMAILENAVSISMNRSTVRHWEKWRHFCGVVWRTVDQARERASTGSGAVVGATPASGVRWKGFRVGPDGCGHCFQCRNEHEDETCRFLQPIVGLEEDEESDECETCGNRNCPWHYALVEDGPDISYQGFLQGAGVGHKEGWQEARYWQRPITAVFGPPVGDTFLHIPPPEDQGDPWAPKPTWDDVFRKVV